MQFPLDPTQAAQLLQNACSDPADLSPPLPAGPFVAGGSWWQLLIASPIYPIFAVMPG